MTESMATLRNMINEAAQGKCNMTAEGKSCPVHGMNECTGYMEEMAPAGISDELAAKKIAAKIMGTPDLNIPKIKQLVTKYLSMVGKAPTDVTHLAALVATELETKGVMESKKKKPDFLDIDGDGNKKEPMKKAAKDAHAGKKPAAKKGGMSAKQAKFFGKKKSIKESHSPAILALMKKYGVQPRASREVDEEESFDSAPANHAPARSRIKMTPALMALMRKYGVKPKMSSMAGDHNIAEGVHITVDGPEANDLISRIMTLAGQPGMSNATPTTVPMASYGSSEEDMCDHCGASYGDCDCDDDHDDSCEHCGANAGECGCGDDYQMMQPAMQATSYGLVDGATMENADYDFGHDDVDDEGETLDLDTYMYKAPTGKQRMVKGMLGDNPLVKESAQAIHAKLKGAYKSYVAEAELNRSNSGAASPLTADNRNEFKKDPFANEKPVTDGSHSPLSKVKRQPLNK